MFLGLNQHLKDSLEAIAVFGWVVYCKRVKLFPNFQQIRLILAHKARGKLAGSLELLMEKRKVESQ